MTGAAAVNVGRLQSAFKLVTPYGAEGARTQKLRFCFINHLQVP
jgi:hypothetical protein